MQRTLILVSLIALGWGWSASSVQPQEEAKDQAGKTKLDQAIDRALDFLKRTQEQDGSWRGASNQQDVAVTSLCVMAYLSAGHVPGEGRYGEVVERGIRWVLTKQADNGLIATTGSYEMYHHGICTLMLAEVAGMTQGKLGAEVRRKLEKAVQLTLRAQRKDGKHKGGWRYRWRSTDGDISVTGWQLMSLRAAKNIGCDVPAETIDMAVDYMKRCQDKSSGAFRYHPGGNKTVACTGTCILGLEICGKQEHHAPEALKAGAYLLKDANLPRWGQGHFFYCVYYCSQATFQLGDNYWSFYRPRLHKVLLSNQKSNGSWHGGDSDSRFGPNYCTAMAVLSLTPEYRFLPIYQRGEEGSRKIEDK